ncbi:hypothetical protein KM295_13235 [Natronomonas sp. F2-12]|uniref:SRPBCC family protein n=1 Tax=Natronomonas aquatica TaxID=2841590 RepID=A0A9R1D6K8_9EURY|nr:hypothetical protein [Natronomonas aquatica]MCQ4334421.1 hypothetical protein [Natronomonas aquatica]
MPSNETSGQRQELQRLTTQYHRIERIATGSVAIVVSALFLGIYLASKLLTAVAAAAVLVIIVRTPVFRSSGTVRLQTDKSPETVIEQLTGLRPPILAFQWCVADGITTKANDAVYSFSYLFGLRSAAMRVRTETETTSEGSDLVELTIKINNEPWGTYTATIDGTGAGSIVEVEYSSDRRFGLRRVPQQLLGKRYHDQALELQGFSVVERERNIGI